MPKNTLKRRIGIGVLIFLVAQAILYGYSLIIIKIVPPGSVITPQVEFMLLTLKVVSWICTPFSRIFLLFGRDLISGFQYAWVILWVINLLGWVALSILLLREKNKPAA